MSTEFEDIVEWAKTYKPDPVVSFSGPTILLVVAGIMITLLLVWWIVLIFSTSRENINDDEGEGEDVVYEVNVDKEE
jgi:hypothetical protein